MPFPLEGVTLVLTGRFADVDAEDARWALIAKGARVMTSVTKTTSALVAGDAPQEKLVAAAAKHKVPVLGGAALRALMEGQTLAQARSDSRQAPPKPLTGRKAVVFGQPSRGTQASIAARLQQLGAEVGRKVSSQTTLIVHCSHTAEGIAAVAKGIDVLLEDDLAALEAGESLSRFLGRRDLAVAAPRLSVDSTLDALDAELRATDTGGERWEDVLTLTLHPGGRVGVSLRELGGTPTEDHVRRVLLRADWPRVGTPLSVERPIVFS